MQTQMGTWKPGVIINKTNDRSFTLKTTDGSEYRRNRRHLQKTNERIVDSDFSNLQVFNQEKPHVEPQMPEPESQVQVRPPNAGNMPNITRYGRQVKPKVIESM